MAETTEKMHITPYYSTLHELQHLHKVICKELWATRTYLPQGKIAQSYEMFQNPF